MWFAKASLESYFSHYGKKNKQENYAHDPWYTVFFIHYPIWVLCNNFVLYYTWIDTKKYSKYDQLQEEQYQRYLINNNNNNNHHENTLRTESIKLSRQVESTLKINSHGDSQISDYYPQSKRQKI